MAKIIEQTGKLAPTAEKAESPYYPIYPHKVDESGAILAKGLGNVADGIFETLDNIKLEQFKDEYYGVQPGDSGVDVESLAQERAGLETTIGSGQAGMDQMKAFTERLSQIDNALKSGFIGIEAADLKKKTILRTAIANAPWLSPDFKSLAAGDPTIGASIGNVATLSGGQMGTRKDDGSLAGQIVQENLKKLTKDGRSLEEAYRGLQLAQEMKTAEENALISEHAVNQRMNVSLGKSAAKMHEDIEQILQRGGPSALGDVQTYIAQWDRAQDNAFLNLKAEATKTGDIHDFSRTEKQFNTDKDSYISMTKAMFHPETNLSVKQKKDAITYLTDHPSMAEIAKRSRFTAGYIHMLQESTGKTEFNLGTAMQNAATILPKYDKWIRAIQENPAVKDQIYDLAMGDGEEAAAAREFIPILENTEAVTTKILRGYGTGTEFASSNKFVQQLQTKVLGDVLKDPEAVTATRQQFMDRANEVTAEGYTYALESYAKAGPIRTEEEGSKQVQDFRQASKNLYASIATELKETLGRFKEDRGFLGQGLGTSYSATSGIQYDPASNKLVAMDAQGKPRTTNHPVLQNVLNTANNYIKANDNLKTWSLDATDEMNADQVKMREIEHFVNHANGLVAQPSPWEAKLAQSAEGGQEFVPPTPQGFDAAPEVEVQPESVIQDDVEVIVPEDEDPEADFSGVEVDEADQAIVAQDEEDAVETATAVQEGLKQDIEVGEAEIVDFSGNYTLPSSGKMKGKPKYFVIHHTAGRYGKGDASSVKAMQRDFATRNKGKASVQYAIDRAGKIYQLMPDNAIAWHAGKTEKMPGVNNRTAAGVEILANDDNDVTDEQVQAALALVKKLGIAPENVFGHGELTGRKQATEGMRVISKLRKSAKEQVANKKMPEGDKTSQATPQKLEPGTYMINGELVEVA